MGEYYEAQGYYEEGEEGEEEEEEEERIALYPGEFHQSVEDAGSVREKLNRLDEWEDQLHRYSVQLAEEKWDQWRKNNVSAIMSELSRKVIPEMWKIEIEQEKARAELLQEQLKVSVEKEKGLLAKIEELQTGPGCAREYREKLEQAEMQLQQQAAKERQRRVLAQMSIGQVAGVQKEETLAGGTSNAPKSEIEAELQLRAAKAEREVRELLEEMTATRVQTNEREDKLRATLDEERKRHRRTREELESLFVDAGMHEAQMLSQLRIEIRALTEENEFLRSREEKVHEEENRLQMVSEMAKKLGTNISKEELINLRRQVASSEEEAIRLHEANMQLQKQVQEVASSDEHANQLKAELAVFQKANDSMEAEVQKEKRRNTLLMAELDSVRERMELLMRQLLMRHVLPARGELAHGEAGKRVIPRLWDGDEADIDPMLGLGRVPKTPTTDRSVPRQLASAHRSFGVSPRVLGGSDHASSGSTVQLQVTAMDPVTPRAARVVPEGCARQLPVKSNEVEVVMLMTKAEVERENAKVKQLQLKRQNDADLQELRAVRGHCKSLTVAARATKLGTLAHWWQTAAVRAFQQWALLLELRVSYNAAFGAAAHVVCEAADELTSSLEAYTRRTVEERFPPQHVTIKTLLMEPSLLKPLGELRFQLQLASREVEKLRERLNHIKVEGYHKASAAPWMPINDGIDELRAMASPRLREHLRSAPAEWAPRVITQTEAHAQLAALATAQAETQAALQTSGEIRAEARRESAYLKLKLRLVVNHWRGLRKQLAAQQMLLRELSSQRNGELSAAAEEHQQLQQLRLTLNEMSTNESMLRQQIAEQDIALASASADSSQAYAEHVEEVKCLSAKIQQLEEEKLELQSALVHQASDLEVLMQAVSS